MPLFYIYSFYFFVLSNEEALGTEEEKSEVSELLEDMVDLEEELVEELTEELQEELKDQENISNTHEYAIHKN